MIFITIVSCVRWCVCVCLIPYILRQSTPFGVCLTYQPGFENKKTNTMLWRVFVLKPNQRLSRRRTRRRRTPTLDIGHYPNRCLVCTANRLSPTSSTRFAVFFIFFVEGMLPIFLFFFPFCYVQKAKRALQHVVLAPWRGKPVVTLYKPLEVSSSHHAVIFFA